MNSSICGGTAPGMRTGKQLFRPVEVTLVDTKTNMSYKCALAAQVNSLLGYIRRSIASRSKRVILPLYSV